MPNAHQPQALRDLQDNLDDALAAVIASVLNQDLHAIRLLGGREHFQAEDIRRVVGHLVQYAGLIPPVESEAGTTQAPQRESYRSGVGRLPPAPHPQDESRVDFTTFEQALGVNEADRRAGET